MPPCRIGTPPVVLTIAASDPLGGAGVQADLATFALRGVHGTSAITAVTVQTFSSVGEVQLISPRVVAAQIDAVCSEMPVAALKTGLLARAEIVELVAERVEQGRLPRPVVDPVMVDRTGRRFVPPEVEAAYRSRLFPVALAVTPNVAEASLLAGAELTSVEEIAGRAEPFRALGAELVVITGGALSGDPQDVCVTADGVWTSAHERIDTDNVRGTGCTFSAAIAAEVANGFPLLEAVRLAGEFVHDSIADSAEWDIGPGGPVSHRVDWDWVD